MKTVKLKKHKWNELKNKLGSGKNILILLQDKIKGITYNLEINLWRGDLEKPSPMNKKYLSTTYILTIEQYDSRYASSDSDFLIDQKLEFNSLEEVVNYLEKNKILKRDDWLVKEDKK